MHTVQHLIHTVKPGANSFKHLSLILVNVSVQLMKMASSKTERCEKSSTLSLCIFKGTTGYADASERLIKVGGGITTQVHGKITSDTEIRGYAERKHDTGCICNNESREINANDRR